MQMLTALFCFLATALGTNPTHYGDPAGGCMADEEAVQVTGLPGSFCSPDCAKTACPTDMPAGDTAQPQCALKGSTGVDKKCALMCTQGMDDAQCGTGSCQPVQGQGK